MQRKWVYRLGIIILLFATLKTPLSYIFFGVTAKGRVVELVFEKSGIALLFPSSTYPLIEYAYQGKTYSMYADENEYLLLGESVNVVFFKDNPSKAKVKSFSSLFLEAIITIPIGLLIWWAFFKSYPKMFVKPRAREWYDDLLNSGKRQKEDNST